MLTPRSLLVTESNNVLEH
uniref:Uncharacterized protein n=1 Tax=Anguilla anguilla TaxID=7936 RepID=A0A0E9VFE4_ANGAN